MALDEDLLRDVADIEGILASHTAQAETERQLPTPVYDALRSKRLFALLLPRALGGFEVPPTTAYRVWEAVAWIDSAAGWNLSQASAGLLMSGGLSPAGRERIFSGNPQPIFAGAGFPPAMAQAVDGGFRIDGRVAFVSGCRHADWIFFVFLNLIDGKPEADPASGIPCARMAFVPRREVEVLDTWHTLGMRGTGSADITFEGLFVPNEMVSNLSAPTPPSAPFDGPLYRLSPWPTIHGEAVVSLGIASAAIARFMALADRVPAMTAQPLKQRELAQINLGRARALTAAARAYLYRSAETAFEAVSAGKPLDMALKIDLQLAACVAAENAAQAVDLLFEAASTASIRLENGLERYFRDAHVATQHATKSVARYGTVGKVLLGLPSDFPLLAG